MTASNAENACIVFVKWPEMGRVKTRLAQGSNQLLALEFYRLCCEQVIVKLAK